MTAYELVLPEGADIGRTISEARCIRGFTQAELADHVGI